MAAPPEKCLRLFLSVDLVGSTAFKNQKLSRRAQDPRSLGGRKEHSRDEPRSVQPWLPLFVHFFKDFPALLSTPYKGGRIASPRLWKTLGDEIVFSAPLHRREEADMHLRHFRDALRSYREEVRMAGEFLDLKGTAWVAGFPVGNSVVHLPDGHDGEAIDFIGPSMDIGFRLKEFASPSRIALSLELAYVLCAPLSQVEVFFIESRPLKGVNGGRPYPAFWTNVFSHESHDLLAKEERLRQGQREPVKNTELADFCQAFIKAYSPPFFLPFIESDPGFNDKPEEYEQDFKEIAKILADASKEDSTPQSDWSDFSTEEGTTDIRKLFTKGLITPGNAPAKAPGSGKRKKS